MYTCLHRAILLISACLSISVSAQDFKELQQYQDSAKGYSTIFRGREQTKYAGLANGHPYWFGKTFGRGDVFMGGKVYRDIELNIDALRQELLVRAQGLTLAVSHPSQSVDSLTMDGKKFINLHKLNAELPEGFFELIIRDNRHAAYRQIRKSMASSVEPVNGQRIGYDDPFYRYDVYDFFEYSASYYFCGEDGKFVRIRKKGDLLRQYPDKRHELRRYAASQGLNYKNTALDEYCREIIDYAGR